MEHIALMNGKEVLKELKTYEPYKNQTDYYIKKSIGTKGPSSTGVNKLATVDELKKELITLHNPKKSKKSPKITSLKKSLKHETLPKSIESPKELSQILPDDVLVQTLLHSDINTIVNVCTSSKNKEKLCDAQFWHSKFEIDHLPLIEKSKNFNDWVNNYSTMMKAKIEAGKMTQIILLFNKYKGDAIIRIWYDKGEYINENVKNHVILEKYMLKQTVAIDLIYKKSWTIGINQENKTKIITYQEVIQILTIEIFNKMLGTTINFHDFDENELYYPNLLKKAKQNKPIPRAYLSMYELLMACGK